MGSLERKARGVIRARQRAEIHDKEAHNAQIIRESGGHNSFSVVARTAIAAVSDFRLSWAVETFERATANQDDKFVYFDAHSRAEEVLGLEVEGQ